MLVFLASCSLLFFVNTIFYTITLLFIVFVSLISLVWLGAVSVLTSFMLVIVYVGAIMIIIGYICAVSPNFTTSSSSSVLLFFVSILLVSLSHFNFSVSTERAIFSPVDFFYSSYGVILFLVLILILFITLLIVTSQYSSPKGPFRSV